MFFKRILVTAAVGGMLVAASVGAASALQVNGVNQQTGSVTLGHCDDDGVTVSAQGYNEDGSVSWIVIDGIDEACFGSAVGYGVYGANDTLIASGAVFDVQSSHVQQNFSEATIYSSESTHYPGAAILQHDIERFVVSINDY